MLRVGMRQDLELRSIDSELLFSCRFHRITSRVYSAGNAKLSIVKANENKNGADLRPRRRSAYPRAPLLHVIVEERHFPFSSAPATFDEIFSPIP
jgi:hypothetical protein